MIILVTGTACGLLETRRPPWGSVVLAGFGVLGAAAVLTRAQFSPLALLPPLAAGLAGVLVLRGLTARVRRYGQAPWLGWPVRTLLSEAGVQPGADTVLSRSEDGWTATTPLEALTDARDSLLAVAMNGDPLPPEHGFPVRLVVPGLYGYVSATKWVTELKVSRFADEAAYWTDRGWS